MLGFSVDLGRDTTVRWGYMCPRVVVSAAADSGVLGVPSKMSGGHSFSCWLKTVHVPKIN